MLGQNGTVGQNGTEQNGAISSYLQRCFILPLCSGQFYPTPTYENFSDESDLAVLGRGSKFIAVEWRILTCELSHHWFR